MTKINTSFRLNKHSPDMLVVKEDLRCVIVDCRTSWKKSILKKLQYFYSG